ncbi:MAG: CotH kinase family protein [Desertimonas sp.]
MFAPRSRFAGLLAAGSAATVAVVGLLPAAVSAAAPAAPVDTGGLGAVGSLSSTEVHEISVVADPAEIEAAIATFRDTGDKEWVLATVTIDGESYDDVGIRLKGNSSLRDVSAVADPATLPWLIDLDREIAGQHHDGLVEMVVRSSTTSTGMNEAVALELLEAAGLASQDAIASSFSVNGGDPVLRLVIDNPDDAWMNEELGEGALYKAESTGDWSYRGDDPGAYDDVFDQEAGDDVADLTPLIEFLQFINESDDASFEAELPDRLDVDGFATYLAMQELLANFDDIDGPGNNAYLFWDPVVERFTIVAWGHNLALGASMGGGGGGRDGGAADGRPRTGGTDGAPGGVGGPPGDLGGPPGDMGGAPGEGDRGGGLDGRSNVLVERFLAVETWNARYQDKLTELRAELVEGGTAAEVVTAWSEVMASSGLASNATISAEAASIIATLGA